MPRIYAQEDNKVLELLGDATRILDYGCGLGRYLSRLHEMGRSITGVDVNSDIVKLHLGKGLHVCLPEDFNATKESHDCIILSHIIEHIPPAEFIIFMDQVVERLDVGGKLIISTPLLYNEFYDDYDHVKPYTHKSIMILFSDYAQQSAKPNNRLMCDYVWFRRWPIIFFTGLDNLELKVSQSDLLILPLKLFSFYRAGSFLGKPDGLVFS